MNKIKIGDEVSDCQGNAGIVTSIVKRDNGWEYAYVSISFPVESLNVVEGSSSCFIPSEVKTN